MPALKVRQWLPPWDDLEFDEAKHQRKPEPHFYLASLPAAELRALAGIYRREAEPDREMELGIQRQHDEDRSDEIAEYVRHGFPWSELSPAKRNSGKYDDLQKPGWLPTAIVVNVLQAGDQRQRRSIEKKDLIEIVNGEGGHAEIRLPNGFDVDWKPTGIAPIEVIDGQHRLWAFDADEESDFDLPVVAFRGLDISWQAYLFYSINITPKKINRSLAYDLYPLLRSEDWLERFEGTPVYRETRAQELTEALWAYPASPWHRRINMLGDKGVGGVTQAAWIRSLMATFIRAYEGRGVRGGIGGLFGARSGEDNLALEWSAAQQAAFLILLWKRLFDRILEDTPPWTDSLAREVDDEDGDDVEPDYHLAVDGRHTLLNSDQGVRGLLHVVNDLFALQADELMLEQWTGSSLAGTTDKAIAAELRSLQRRKAAKYLGVLAGTLSSYDWRSSNAANLSKDLRERKARFRGSGGYRELRMELTAHLIDNGPREVSEPAARVAEILDFAV